MASIPHGTTINAQGLAAVKVEKVDGTLTSPPDIKVSKDLDASRPFTLDNGTIVPFDKDQFNLDTTPEKKKKDATRLPQDLEPFFKLDSFESITRPMILDPNTLILKHDENKRFSQVIMFKVSTMPVQDLKRQACPHLAAREAMNAAVASIDKIEQVATADAKIKNAVSAAKKTLAEALNSVRSATAEPAIGSANIAFLDGDIGKPRANPGTDEGRLEDTNPNARTGKVESTFWISTIVYTIEVKEDWVPGEPKFLELDPIPDHEWAKGTVPSFVFPADKTVEAGRYEVEATQIQYSQTVDLIFNGLAWPHISVATIIPVRPVLVNFARRVGPVAQNG
jgi:hypothetical protein